MIEDFPLDTQQERVASAGIPERLYVIAGPGSGKTETVSARLRHLIQEEEVDSGSLLVISFSRAAVEAVENRLRANCGLGGVWVTTLDALAARLLADCATDIAGMSFDRRIQRAKKLIDSEGLVTQDCCVTLKHVIVDEVQDIVGIRADFLAALLAGLSPEAGFTLLGDPCQAIYDFQKLADSLDAPGLQGEAVRIGAEVVRLSGQYRAQTGDARVAMSIRRPADLASWTTAMERHLTTMESVPPKELVPWLQRTPGPIAILTQSNAQALVVAHRLWSSGVAADLLSAPTERPLAPWIARTLGMAPRKVSRDEFAQLIGPEESEIIQSRWLSLRRLTAASGNTLDVQAVSRRLATGAAPTSFFHPRGRIVVSTVHRAKGLEFDHVLLLDPASWYRREGDEADYARALYVAMTRPRRRLFTVAAEKATKRWREDRSMDRAVARPGRGYGLLGIEVRGIDWAAVEPPASDGRESAGQELLAHVAEIPTTAEVRLDPYLSTLERPYYVAFLDDERVGTFSSTFVDAFLRAAGPPKKGWPVFNELFLLGTQTVAGLAGDGPIGKNGLWLAPVIAGSASLEWNR